MEVNNLSFSNTPAPFVFSIPSPYQPSQDEIADAIQAIDKRRLLESIHQDPTIQHTDKSHLLQVFSHPDGLATLAVAGSGALLANSISKYLNLDRTTQFLLSLAGFGIGSILVNKIRGDNVYTDYDPKTGTTFLRKP